MAYTKAQIREELYEDINKRKLSLLYSAKCVNRNGITSDKPSVPYSEIISEWILSNISLFYSHTIRTINREMYKVSDKNKKKMKDAPTQKKPVINKDKQPDEDWDEEWIAKFMYNDGNNNYDSVGHIFCCQVPLKKPRGNEPETDERKTENQGVGNIDMVSYDGENVYLLELKKRTNTGDSLLRTILETFTYWKRLNHTNFRNSYSDIVSASAPIIPAIVIFKDSLQYDQYNNKAYGLTRSLIKRFGIKVFLAQEIGDKKYSIVEIKQ